MYFKDRSENDDPPVIDVSSISGNCPLQWTFCQHFICSWRLAWGGGKKEQERGKKEQDSVVQKGKEAVFWLRKTEIWYVSVWPTGYSNWEWTSQDIPGMSWESPKILKVLLQNFSFCTCLGHCVLHEVRRTFQNSCMGHTIRKDDIRGLCLIQNWE